MQFFKKENSHETKSKHTLFSKIKLTEVKKIKSGMYRLNDCVQISNLTINNDGSFSADMHFDDKSISEKNAEKLMKLFVSEALTESLKSE